MRKGGVAECLPPTFGLPLAFVLQIMDLLLSGNTRRSVSPTDANEVSSRSHAVLQVTVQQKDRTADVRAAVKVGKLALIDLAGSGACSPIPLSALCSLLSFLLNEAYPQSEPACQRTLGIG